MNRKVCFVLLCAMVGLMVFGQALAKDSSVWKDDQEEAFLLVPLKLPWYNTKFLFYDFPKAAFYQLPADKVERFYQPEKSQIARLMEDLNDDDLIVKDFILQELKRRTGQSFGYKPFSYNPEELKGAIRQWNQWWEQNRDHLPEGRVPRPVSQVEKPTE